MATHPSKTEQVRRCCELLVMQIMYVYIYICVYDCICIYESHSSSSRKTKQVKYCKKCQGTVSGPAVLWHCQYSRRIELIEEMEKATNVALAADPHATGTWRKDVRHTSREMNESQQKSEQHLVKTCRNHCSTNSETENLANLISCLHISPSLSALSIRIHYIIIISWLMPLLELHFGMLHKRQLRRYVHAL